MDDNRPLFTTFKPFGEDNKARAKPAPSTTPIQPQGAEPLPGHHSRHGRVPPGSWSPPAAQSLPEGDLCSERVALRARTRLWFEQTQAQRLGPEGELPTWFHGFISRREAEELLQDQPLGCFLVRFSESTIGFVLSYRGRDRCRHFVLDQLPDGRYVILGERSAHAELAELLQHHASAPVSPYREFLTVPLPKTSPEDGHSPQLAGMLHIPRREKPQQRPRSPPEPRAAPPGRLPARRRRSLPRAAPGARLGGRVAPPAARQRPRLPMPRCTKKPPGPSPPRPSTSSSCVSTSTPSPASPRSASPRNPSPRNPSPRNPSPRSPSPSTPWPAAADPAPAPRRTSTPRWHWPGRSCLLGSPRRPKTPSPRCPPSPDPTASSSAAFPARTARGGSWRPLPARTGRTEELPAQAQRSSRPLQWSWMTPCTAGAHTGSSRARPRLRTCTSSCLGTAPKHRWAQDTTWPPGRRNLSPQLTAGSPWPREEGSKAALGPSQRCQSALWGAPALPAPQPSWTVQGGAGFPYL